MGQRVGLGFKVGTSDIQGARDYQEDSYAVCDPNGSNAAFEEIDSLSVAVADGVGGEVAGNVASQTVVTVFSRAIQSRSDGEPWPDVLHSSLVQANEAVRNATRQDPTLHGMASTLIAVLINNDKLWWISVGDSHLYLIRKGLMTKLNADHSIGAVLNREVEAGNITPEEAAQDPRRNMLLSCIMGESLNEVDLSQRSVILEKGDRLVLATDGLNTLAMNNMVQISQLHTNAQAFAEALTYAVESQHEVNQDNTQIVVVDLFEKQDTKTPSLFGGWVLYLAALLAIVFAILFFTGSVTPTPESSIITQKPPTSSQTRP
ncbi:MAG TPA: serine/threonine-protein phosphatase [Acidiferrobacteraceae bacterium]|mgnify:CR=1 FL=1|nr:serine/threonine-protein phosphatase [Acidiferrobacteraceae bacterium]